MFVIFRNVLQFYQVALILPTILGSLNIYILILYFFLWVYAWIVLIRCRYSRRRKYYWISTSLPNSPRNEGQLMPNIKFYLHLCRRDLHLPCTLEKIHLLKVTYLLHVRQGRTYSKLLNILNFHRLIHLFIHVSYNTYLTFRLANTIIFIL